MSGKLRFDMDRRSIPNPKSSIVFKKEDDCVSYRERGRTVYGENIVEWRVKDLESKSSNSIFSWSEHIEGLEQISDLKGSRSDRADQVPAFGNQGL